MIKTSVTTEASIIAWINDQIDTGYNVNTNKINVKNGKLEFVMLYNASGYYNATFTGNTTINDDTWHHVAVVKSNDTNNNLLIYVDGVLNIIGTIQSHIFTSKNTFLGANGRYFYEPPIANPNYSKNNKNSEINKTLKNAYPPTPVDFFQGNLDEVRVWNRALSLAELQNNKNCELPSPTTQTGLVAYYQFNQGIDSNDNSTVTTLTDASSNGYNGTLNSFALNGSTSNWTAGSNIVSGDNCAPFLSTTNFELNHQLKLYPNPATNEVTIQFESLTNPQLEVIDVNGRILLNQPLDYTSNKLNIAALPLGMYLFKINSKEGIVMSKIIKN